MVTGGAAEQGFDGDVGRGKSVELDGDLEAQRLAEGGGGPVQAAQGTAGQAWRMRAFHSATWRGGEVLGGVAAPLVPAAAGP